MSNIDPNQTADDLLKRFYGLCHDYPDAVAAVVLCAETCIKSHTDLFGYDYTGYEDFWKKVIDEAKSFTRS